MIVSPTENLSEISLIFCESLNIEFFGKFSISVSNILASSIGVRFSLWIFSTKAHSIA